MQLYVVTWRFQSAEYQTFAAQALREYVDSGKLDDSFEGYERIAWVHTPQDGTGTVICRAESAAVLYRVFSPWRNKFGMSWDYKLGLSTEELVDLIKESA